MKVIGLISGGKDSCYNLMQCVAAGHEIACLVNLHPPEGVDELDSYMYQSVGSTALQVRHASLAFHPRRVVLQ
jgi:diphthine-ammonia ligase